MFEGCDDMGIRKSTSRFVAPLAATLKADGSAVFIAAASTFVAQLEGVGGDPGKIVVIWLVFLIAHSFVDSRINYTHILGLSLGF